MTTPDVKVEIEWTADDERGVSYGVLSSLDGSTHIVFRRYQVNKPGPFGRTPPKPKYRSETVTITDSREAAEGFIKLLKE